MNSNTSDKMQSPQEYNQYLIDNDIELTIIEYIKDINNAIFELIYRSLMIS